MQEIINKFESPSSDDAEYDAYIAKIAKIIEKNNESFTEWSRRIKEETKKVKKAIAARNSGKPLDEEMRAVLEISEKRLRDAGIID